jgi:hypothetical protein
MPGAGRHRGSVRALDAGNLAEQRPGVLVYNHHTILPGENRRWFEGSGTMRSQPLPAEWYVCMRRYDKDDCANSDVMAANVRMRTALRMMTPFYLEHIQAGGRRSPGCH